MLSNLATILAISDSWPVIIVYNIIDLFLYLFYIVLSRTRNRVHPVHESVIQYAVLHLPVDVTVLHDVLSGPEQRGNLTY